MAGRISYLGGIVKDGLILDLDAGKVDSYPRTGTLWRDLSGNGYNGTLTNFEGQFWDSSNGGNILFDGTDSYVNLSDIPFRITNYNFSIELVFYFNGVNDSRPLVSKRNPNPPFNSYGIFIGSGNVYVGGSGNKLGCFVRDDNNPNNNSTNDRALTYTMSQAGIYHVILTNDISTIKFWVNGVSSSEAASGSFGGGSVPTATSSLFSGNFNVTGYNFRVGNNYTTNYFNNKIYLTRFYNRTLSNSEILQNYNALKGRYNL